MIELIQRFSAGEIIIFIVLFAIAVKKIVDFIDWVNLKIKNIFDKKNRQIQQHDKIIQRLKQGDDVMAGLQQNQKVTDEILNSLLKKINLLIQSDKDDIKSYITREHHYFCYQKKWIDDFSLDCLERRYQHYADEGGNSFIEDFMQELRALPKQPPQKK